MAAYSPLHRFEAQAIALGRPLDKALPRSAALKQAIGYGGSRGNLPIRSRLLTPEHQAELDARVARGEIETLPEVDLSSGPEAGARRRIDSTTARPEQASLQAERPSRSIPSDVSASGTLSGGVADRFGGNNVVQVSGSVEAGMVLVSDLDHPGWMKPADSALDPGVVGIVGGEPGTAWSGSAPLITSGIVSCRVDTSAGPIAVNDLLVSAAAPGHAMRHPAGNEIEPGTILGKVLEPLQSGSGTIRILVMLR